MAMTDEEKRAYEKAVALGYCAAFGTLIPPLVQGTFGALLSTTGGWMVLSGAAGHTYGSAGIWHAGVEGDHGNWGAWGRQPYDWTTWKEGMNYPGSTQLGLGRKLLEQYPWSRFEVHPEWAPGCFATGIPGEVRFVYLPRRGIYNWDGPEVKDLEPDVDWHVYYWDPATGRKFDQGTINATAKTGDKDAKPVIFKKNVPSPQDWVLVFEEQMKEPIQLHPTNPHYLLWRGKPTVLITSGEHYSSVLNLEFDYRVYLDTLHSEGLNHTRLFVGVYRELPNQYWPKNPLGPQPGQFVCPYARSAVPGAKDGGNKFDLDKWDDVFFKRLLDFCRLADERGIVVEINLFCPHYEERMWNLSPWNPNNNINELGAVPQSEVYSLKQPKLLVYQEVMVRKIVRMLNPFDNLYFETINLHIS